MPLTPLRVLIVAGPAVAFLFVVWLRQLRDDRRLGRDRVVEIACGGLAVVALTWFFQFGRLPPEQADWRKDFTYYSSLQDALQRGRMPYYLSMVAQDTDRYLANLETPLGPDVILLPFMSVGTFFLLHVLLAFVIGYGGLLALKHELSLSSFTFVVFVALFLFNGHITAHLAAGHTPWAGYFLLPWVFVCLGRSARGDETMRNSAILAVVLAGMIAIGAWHIFIWSLLFTACFFAAQPSGPRRFTEISTLVLYLSAFRLLPALVTFGGGSNDFLTGWNSPRMMFDALTIGRTHSFARESLAWWEYDTYIGGVGLLIAAVGLRPFRERDLRFMNRFYAPAAILLILSCGRIYGSTLFLLPGFVSERITTRFLIMPVLVLLLIGCVRMDRWLVRRIAERRIVALLILAAAGVLVGQLLVNTLRWRLPEAGTSTPPASAYVEKTPVEPGYLWGVWCGSVASVIALGMTGRAIMRGE